MWRASYRTVVIFNNSLTAYPSAWYNRLVFNFTFAFKAMNSEMFLIRDTLSFSVDISIEMEYSGSKRFASHTNKSATNGKSGVLKLSIDTSLGETY
nr:unnamed protein product [Callosobruchus analis]